MASKFDGKTTDGICWSYLRDKDGKIRKDGKGRDMKSYTWRYRDARGTSRQITGRNLDQVRRNRDETRDKINKGTYRDPRNGQIIVEDYAAGWLAKRKPFIDHNTWSTHEKRIRNHIIPRLGHLRMNQLDAGVIDEFKAYLADGVALGTARCYFGTLNQIIKDALDKGVLTHDPRQGTTKIAIKKDKKRFPFAPGEIAAIENEATGEMRRLIRIARGTGLRISEVLALDEAQFDLTPGAEMLHVDRQIGKDDKHGRILKDPKSTKGDRYVPLPAWVVAEIKAQQQAAPTLPYTMTWVHRDKSTETVKARFLFHDGTGAPLAYEPIRNRWNTLVKVAGVTPTGAEGTGLHRLRHTFAGDLIRSGIDIYLVSRILGHSSVQVTEMFYAHLRRESLEAARVALNALSEPRATLALAPAA